MRRGRIFGGAAAAVATAALGFGVAVAPISAAATASPMDICRDLADGQLNGTYTQDELNAYVDALAHDPTVQGYCSPLVIVTTPPTTTTTPGTTTPGTTTVVTTTTPGGSTTTLTQTVPGTTTPGTTTTIAGTPPPTSTNGVLGVASPSVVSQTPTSQVAGAQKTKTAPSTASAAPLSTTRSSGALPFTGLELGVFAAVGIALVAGGLLLRTSTRRRDTRA